MRRGLKFNMKSKKTLIAVLAISNILSMQPSLAFDVEEAKHLVKEGEERKQEDPSYYAHTLLILAVEYFKAGDTEKADETFRKSLAPAKAAESMVPDSYPAHLMMYAQLLSEGRNSMGVQPEDFERTDAALKEALAVMDARPDPGNRNFEYLSAIEIFEKTGNIALANKYRKIVLNYCAKVEEDPKAPQTELIQAGAMLTKLAEVVFPAGPIREMPTIVVKLEPDSNKASKLTESRFKQAEQLKLRALHLADRLPDKDQNRIAQHTGMVYWYTLFGQSAKAQEQTKLLEGLLGTTDRAKLFPPRQPCPGMCGLG